MLLRADIQTSVSFMTTDKVSISHSMQRPHSQSQYSNYSIILLCAFVEGLSIQLAPTTWGFITCRYQRYGSECWSWRSCHWFHVTHMWVLRSAQFRWSWCRGATLGFLFLRRPFIKGSNKTEAKVVPTPTDNTKKVILRELLNGRLIGSWVLRPVSSSLVVTRRAIWAND
jgi:hypothetical protein